MSNPPLFTPYRMGDLDLPNRIVMDRERGNRLIAEGLADLVAFGRPFIANPDLVERFAKNVSLAEVDWETVYASGPHGYSDYPAYQSSEDNPRS